MFSKDYKKIVFYPNWKFFSQKFIRWNAELDKQKIFFDIMGTLSLSLVTLDNRTEHFTNSKQLFGYTLDWPACVGMACIFLLYSS